MQDRDSSEESEGENLDPRAEHDNRDLHPKEETKDFDPSVPLDSIELVRSGRNGDRDALNTFLSRYHPRLLRVVRIRMGSFLLRHIDPEDIVQESFMVAVDKLATFRTDQGSNLMCWLTKISDHVTSNHRTRIQAQKRDPGRERRLQSTDPSSMTARDIDLSDGRPTPSQVMSGREMEERVDRCVESLEPNAYRQVILMRDYMEADWETICTELDRPSVDSARELHRRARIRLREKLDQADVG